jgi:hypothetical protein
MTVKGRSSRLRFHKTLRLAAQYNGNARLRNTREFCMPAAEG